MSKIDIFGRRRLGALLADFRTLRVRPSQIRVRPSPDRVRPSPNRGRLVLGCPRGYEDFGTSRRRTLSSPSWFQRIQKPKAKKSVILIQNFMSKIIIFGRRRLGTLWSDFRILRVRPSQTRVRPSPDRVRPSPKMASEILKKTLFSSTKIARDRKKQYFCRKNGPNPKRNFKKHYFHREK